ncbi:manganese/iron superoxide dismutase, partial [Kipferlia bialata]|eukprot:g13217.t1
MELEVHYTKHHQGYCNKTNAVLEGERLARFPIEYVLEHVDELPVEKRQKLINVGGGLANHSFFWHSLTPTPQEVPEGLKDALFNAFGSMDAFKAEMVNA